MESISFFTFQGVIFSLKFEDSGLRLLSVSDDRSIRVWEIDKEECLQIYYGHKARVWTASFLGENLVSVGEDSACILWNQDGSIMKKFKGHKGSYDVS